MTTPFLRRLTTTSNPNPNPNQIDLNNHHNNHNNLNLNLNLKTKRPLPPLPFNNNHNNNNNSSSSSSSNPQIVIPIQTTTTKRQLPPTPTAPLPLPLPHPSSVSSIIFNPHLQLYHNKPLPSRPTPHHPSLLPFINNNNNNNNPSTKPLPAPPPPLHLLNLNLNPPPIQLDHSQNFIASSSSSIIPSHNIPDIIKSPVLNEPQLATSSPIIPVFNLVSVDHQDVPVNHPPQENQIPPIAIDPPPPPSINLIIHGPPSDNHPPIIISSTPPNDTTPSSPLPSTGPPSSTPTIIPSSIQPLHPNKPCLPSSPSHSSLSSLFCAACNQLIAGRVVNALSKRYHPDCFTCEHCNLALEHVAFYEHDGKPYCGVDYDELFSLKCHHCNTSITDESYVTLSDPSLGDGQPRYYHQLHLFCAECGDPFVNPKSLEETSRISKKNQKPQSIHHPDLVNLENSSPQKPLEEPKAFVLHKGYAFCEDCHVRLYKPKCWACKKSIVGDILSALGKQWHEGCFKCKGCQHPFLNGLFFLSNQHDPFCETCYSLQLS